MTHITAATSLSKVDNISMRTSYTDSPLSRQQELANRMIAFAFYCRFHPNHFQTGFENFDRKEHWMKYIVTPFWKIIKPVNATILTALNTELFMLEDKIFKYLFFQELATRTFHSPFRMYKNFISKLISKGGFGFKEPDIIDIEAERWITLDEDIIILDTRFLNTKEIFKTLISSQYKPVVVVDIEISIPFSVLVSLNTNPYKKDAFGNIICQTLEQIKKRFLYLRKNRMRLIMTLVELNSNYCLYRQAINGMPIIVAVHTNKNFILFKNKFFSAFKLNIEKSIEKFGSRIIDNNFIDYYPFEDDGFNKEYRKGLEKWKGFTVRDALSMHLKTPFSDNFLSDEFNKNVALKTSDRTKLDWEDLLHFYLNPTAKKIIKFVMGMLNFNELFITHENGRNFLMDTKVIDRSFKKNGKHCLNSTFAIRSYIASISSAHLTTNEVFTNSIKDEEFNDMQYLANPQNWVTERVGLQARSIMIHQLEARFLSQRLKEPAIFAVRGGCGLGKSSFFQELIKAHNIDMKRGTLNPDQLKVSLKNSGSLTLLNSQVFIEAKVLFQGLMKTLSSEVSGIEGAIVDTRLLNIEDLELLLQMADVRKARLEIVDINGSIWCSIVAVLNRSPATKEEPRVTFDVIKEGFMKARINRPAFIDAAKKCKSISYSLYHRNNDERILVGKINNGNSLCYDEDILNHCLSTPSADEYDVGGHTITEDLIAKHEYFGKKIPSHWIGKTVEAALLEHSQIKDITSYQLLS